MQHNAELSLVTSTKPIRGTMPCVVAASDVAGAKFRL
jgi:hypothetical protein